jgi:tetratricopeptide (TPR) repeat protein
MSRWQGWGRGVVVAASLALVSSSAAAAPSVWQRARVPEVGRRAALIAEAGELLLKYQGIARSRYEQRLDGREIDTLGELYLTRAAQLLEAAGAATSKDLFVRDQLAEIYASDLVKKNREAAALLESIARADPPPPLRARVYAQLAIAYAHLDRVDDEIAAYGEALRVQPVAGERSLLLANRAEALMRLGDVTDAIAGYRAALALLTSDYLLVEAPTTLWGLAVALDRSGDLDGGLETVRLARAYDPKDTRLDGLGWFFSPDYDRHWYHALGHWAVARKADLDSVRAESYSHAVTDWEEYVASAAHDDKWVDLARVRLRQCEKERDELLRRSRRGAPAK